MKTEKIIKAIKPATAKTFVVIFIISLMFFTSCEKYGTDGIPGKAFLSVNWDVSVPTNLDVGTSDIPAVFEWGTYYRAYPATNTLYYDGKVWKGTYWADYAWQVDYEIYENPGQKGGPNYNGKDGMNSYFDIVCSPYGPNITSYDAKIKPNDNPYDLNSVPEIVTVIKSYGNYSIKITYKKVKLPDNPDQSMVPVKKITGSAK